MPDGLLSAHNSPAKAKLLLPHFTDGETEAQREEMTCQCQSLMVADSTNYLNSHELTLYLTGLV
jgi:hypothetical protein